MKNLLLFNLLFLLSINCFAQTQNHAVIYLKNGSIIHGTIIPQTQDSIVKIKTKDGDVFVYKHSEVEKITPVSTYHTPINPSRQVVHHPIVDTSKWSGLFVSPQLFFGTKLSSNSQEYFLPGILIEQSSNKTFDTFNLHYGIQAICGYQHKKLYSIGIGFGLNRIGAPVFLNARINLNLNNNLNPFIELSAGNVFGDSNADWDGFSDVFINPTIGISAPISHKSYIDIGIVASFQRLPFSSYALEPPGNQFSPYYYQQVTDYKIYKFLQLKVGFTFLR